MERAFSYKMQKNAFNWKCSVMKYQIKENNWIPSVTSRDFTVDNWKNQLFESKTIRLTEEIQLSGWLFTYITDGIQLKNEIVKT